MRHLQRYFLRNSQGLSAQQVNVQVSVTPCLGAQLCCRLSFSFTHTSIAQLTPGRVCTSQRSSAWPMCRRSASFTALPVRGAQHTLSTQLQGAVLKVCNQPPGASTCLRPAHFTQARHAASWKAKRKVVSKLQALEAVRREEVTHRRHTHDRRGPCTPAQSPGHPRRTAASACQPPVASRQVIISGLLATDAGPLGRQVRQQKRAMHSHRPVRCSSAPPTMVQVELTTRVSPSTARAGPWMTSAALAGDACSSSAAASGAAHRCSCRQPDSFSLAQRAHQPGRDVARTGNEQLVQRDSKPLESFAPVTTHVAFAAGCCNCCDAAVCSSPNERGIRRSTPMSDKRSAAAVRLEEGHRFTSK